MDSPKYRKAIQDCDLIGLITAINEYVALYRPVFPPLPEAQVIPNGSMEHKPKLIECSPLATILFDTANVCMRQGYIWFAIAIYQRALNAGNTRASVYENLAASYKALGEYKKAVKTYELLISQIPTYTPAYARIAVLIQRYKIKSKKTPSEYFVDYHAKGGTNEQLTALGIGHTQKVISDVNDMEAHVWQRIKDKTTPAGKLLSDLGIDKLPTESDVKKIRAELGAKLGKDVMEDVISEISTLDKMLRQQADFVREAYNPNLEGRVKSLFDALNKRDPDEAVSIMELDGELINSVDEWGSYPLHKAAHSCLFSVVKFILDNGGALNVKDKWNHTPLHWASCLTVAEILIENGAEIEGSDGCGWTPLYAIARDGHLDSARYLIHKGANVNVRTSDQARFDQPGWTPLHISAHKGRTEIVRLLLASNADIEAISGDGRTPFQVTDNNHIRALLSEAKSDRVKSKRSQQYENTRNESLITAFHQLSSRFPKLDWAKAFNPYTEMVDECKRLMTDDDFRGYVTNYLNTYPDVERAFRGFESSVKRQQFSTWSDLPENVNDTVWQGFFVERWRPAFLMLDSPAKYFLIRDQGPLHWRNLPPRCPNINSATWLLRQPDFWAMRHSFAHTNFAWETNRQKSFLLAYDDHGTIKARLGVFEAEAFAVIVSSFVSVLIDVFVSSSGAQPMKPDA